MSERTDRKLESVMLARFPYRHEAEFAAGFLTQAGIPYRLQVDDAAMAMTSVTSATIWVRDMDLREAREILDLPDERVGSGRALPRQPRAPIATGGVERVARCPDGSQLTELERSLALLISIGCGGAATLTATLPGGPLWLLLLAGAGGPLGFAALTGRALAPIRRLLRAISGSAP